MIFCKECKFWNEEKDEITRTGECRIKPPVLVSAIAAADIKNSELDIYNASRFPVTLGGDWCGEGRINDVPDRPRRV